MSDRLNELQRQRALAQEQVAWFDREITRERGDAILPEAPQPAHVVAPLPQASAKLGAVAAAMDTELRAAEIIERFQKTERPVKDDVRRGCFLYFFTAFLLLGLAAFAFYLLHRPQE